MIGTPDAELRAWLVLIHAPGLGPVLGRRLLEHCGSAEAVLDADPQAFRAAGVPEALRQALQRVDVGELDRDLEWLSGDGRGFVPLHDPRYPPLLKEIAQPPLGLFFQGDLRHGLTSQLAVVGARTASPQGLENARAFAAELVRRGFAVTSGLAQGIDGAAHRGALQAGGITVAVCATGLDRVYPARHRELAHEIAARGVLLSEFPPGTPPLAENFPRRNRIISGLACGVLVVEAAPQSGSLITARYALEQGREVFAIPGSIHSPLSRGCHELLRQGAKLTESIEDILEELPTAADGRPSVSTPEDVSSSVAGDGGDAAQRLLDALGFDPVSFDKLLERTTLPLETLSTLLLDLELKGRVVSLPGGSYQRVVRP